MYTGCPENGAFRMHYGVQGITINVRKMLKKFYWTFKSTMVTLQGNDVLVYLYLHCITVNNNNNSN
jgi:hypothetical protein